MKISIVIMNSCLPQANENLNKVKESLEKNPKGLTIREVSNKVDLNRNSVAKYLEILTISGEVERRKIGPSKVYTLSEKVPLSAVLNYTDNCIVVLSDDMDILQVNQEFFDKFNLDKEDVVGVPIEEVDIPLFRRNKDDGSVYSFPQASILPEIQTALNEDKQEDVETSFEFGSKRFYLEIDMVPTTFQNGEAGLTLILKDITKRKKAEDECRKYRKRLQELVKKRSKEIKRTKERLSSLINASDDSIYMVDRDCRYVIVNEELVSRLSKGEGEIVGESFSKFHSEDETREFQKKIDEVFESGDTVKHMHSWEEPERQFLRTLSPVKDPSGDTKNVAVISKDITFLVD